MRPVRAARVPERMESSPRLAPMVRSSMMRIGAGREPARRTMASLRASSIRKLPSMMPDPPRMGPRMTGADWTRPSRMMAMFLPTLAAVRSPKSLPPSGFHLKATMGMPLSPVSTRADSR
ncbi:MAG: Uncharacterized protein FD126_2330 [Elusimicrobia bacterium]|nr:MAG: Uncharacterized protein FD126_2330 [Elusimicrobiota bacterium]